MIKKCLMLIVGAIMFITQACNFPMTELREIKFMPEMQLVADKYKKQLDPEIFQTSPAWFSFDTVTTHKVVVTLLNSKKLPESEEEIKDIAVNMASDIYLQLINKNDFSRIEIVFQNQSGTVVRMRMKRNYPFTYEEIEEYIGKRSSEVNSNSILNVAEDFKGEPLKAEKNKFNPDMALFFLNNYVALIENRESKFDWIEKNMLVTSEFIAMHKKLYEDAIKEDPEYYMQAAEPPWLLS